MAAIKHEGMPEAIPGQLGISVGKQGTTTTISLRGEWDLAHKSAMREAVTEVFAGSPEYVVLDLAGLSFIDSTGVHGVIELHRRSQQQGARLVIVPGPRAVQRIFELLGLTEDLPFPHRRSPHQSLEGSRRARLRPSIWRHSLPAISDVGRPRPERPASLTQGPGHDRQQQPLRGCESADPASTAGTYVCIRT